MYKLHVINTALKYSFISQCPSFRAVLGCSSAGAWRVEILAACCQQSTLRFCSMWYRALRLPSLCISRPSDPCSPIVQNLRSIASFAAHLREFAAVGQRGQQYPFREGNRLVSRDLTLRHYDLYLVCLRSNLVTSEHYYWRFLPEICRSKIACLRALKSTSQLKSHAPRSLNGWTNACCLIACHAISLGWVVNIFTLTRKLLPEGRSCP